MPAQLRPRRRAFPDLQSYLLATQTPQTLLAARLGISQAHLSRIARGLSLPSWPLAVKLARVCHVPLNSFHRAYVAAHAERVA